MDNAFRGAPLIVLFAHLEITTVLWATGFRPDDSWLDIPVRGRNGRIRHDGGAVTGAFGLYVLGLPCSAPAPPPTSTAQVPTPAPWPTGSSRCRRVELDGTAWTAVFM